MPTPLEEPPSFAPAMPPCTIFLVDDNADDLTLTRRILKGSPHIRNVVCITNASDLLRELQVRHRPSEKTPDDNRSLILLDIHMPDLDGFSLLNRLKSTPGVADIPVVMLTGDHRTDNIEKTYHMNAESFIVKPLREEHLTHIHAILDGESRRREIF